MLKIRAKRVETLVSTRFSSGHVSRYFRKIPFCAVLLGLYNHAKS